MLEEKLIKASEQPTAKGYPPSVVSLIPKLIERSGPGIDQEGFTQRFIPF